MNTTVTVKVQTPFVTPVFTSDVDVSACLPEVLDYYEKHKDNGQRVTNIGGWQSEPLAFGDMNSIDVLVQAMYDMAARVYPTLGVERKPMVQFCWLNINKTHDFNVSHTHAGTVLTSVVYIDVPQGSGELVLERPDNSIAYGLPDAITDYNRGTFSVEPYTGLAIMFPGYLRHHVMPNTFGEGALRISFGVNFQ